MSRKIAVLILATLVLAACGSAPQRKAEPAKVSTAPGGGGYLAGDGPIADTGINLDAIPDAVPRTNRCIAMPIDLTLRLARPTRR